jgi:Protein of unknown function (DUF3176)
MSIQPPNFALRPLRNNADRGQDLEPVSAVSSVTSTEAVRFYFGPREGNSEQINHYEAREARPHQDADSEYAAAPSQILHLNDQRTGGDAEARARCSWKPNRQVVVRSWWMEIGSLLLSSGFLAAIAIILVQHNHERQSSWKGINLTTLIAVMSTFLRASMMTAVEEGEPRNCISCKEIC